MTTFPRPRHPLRLGAAWWCAPDLLMIGVIIPLTILCLATGGTVLRNAGYADYITLASGVGIVTALLAYAAGACFGRSVRLKPVAAIPVPNLYMDVMFLLTVCAYLVFFLPFFNNPRLLFSVLAGVPGAVYDAREKLQTIPGLTTFTQAGVAYVCLYVGRSSQDPPRPRRHTLFLAAIILFGLLRAFLRSERLALLELLVPLVIAYAICHRHHRWIGVWPFLGLLTIYGFFAATEYFRTWTNYYAHQGMTLAGFILRRIQDYYLYSLNNGLGYLEFQKEGGQGLFFFSLDWFYKFPGLGHWFVTSFHVVDPTERFLTRFADPGLNSFAGIVALICDFGWFGGCVAAALMGLLAGMSYRGMLRQEGLLRYYYPLLFVGTLEIIRIHYLSTGRTFPIFFLLLIPFLFSGSKRRHLMRNPVVDASVGRPG